MSTITTAARRSGPWFGLGFVLACTLLVFYGFSFTFLGRVVEQLRPLVLYAHVATAGSWLLLLVAQAALARSRKLALHRRLGKYGFILGVLAAASAFGTALVLRHDAVVGGGLDHRAANIAFLAIPLNGAIAFSILLACAYLWRLRPDRHRRCMMLAAAVLTLPAAARIPGIGDRGIWALAPTAALLLILCAADLWREKRLHKVYLIGVPAYLAQTFACVWLATSAPDWWVRTAAFLCGVPAA